IFNRQINIFYVHLEDRFFDNYHDRERQEAIKSRNELAPWDAHVTQFRLMPGTPVSGMTLEEMALRERIGVNIAMIRRGEDYYIPAPSRFERVYPGDNLFVIGTDDQLDHFKKYIEPLSGIQPRGLGSDEVVLRKVVVTKKSFLFKKTIRESGIREKTNGLVVGLERNKRRVLNPESNMILEDGDMLWVVGDRLLIEEFIDEIVNS
ncbi:MAG: sodium:proton antiporter, partial [Sphingobacteriales bacterium]